MEIYSGLLRRIIDFLFFYPKSTTMSAIFLSIIVAIAWYVNKRRDASGKVSFIDMGKTGITGLRLYETEGNIRKNSWLIPLWIPEAHLLLKIKMLLPKGTYEIKAYWKAEKHHSFGESIFKKQPVDQEKKAYSVSQVGKFEVPKEMPVEFMLTLSGEELHIDSPDKSRLISAPDIPSIPLVISEPSLKKTAQKFEKLKKTKIWELSVTDEQIIMYFEYEIKSMNRKLEWTAVKNRELESNLDKMIIKLKHLRQAEKPELKKKIPAKD